MVTTEEQPRTADGRFGRRARNVSSLHLIGRTNAANYAYDRPGPDDGDMEEPSEWDDHNAEGTYSYPPEAVCAEQVIAFWRRCPIPDAVLAQIQRAHPEVRQVLVRQRIEGKHPSAGRPKEKTFSTDSKAAAAAWDQAHQQAISEAEEHFPPAPMPATEVRRIVRAMRAVDHADNSRLSDKDAKVVASEPSGLSWAGYDLTWGNIAHFYGAYTYADWVWQDPALTRDGKLDRLDRKIDELTTAVSAIKDGQDADFLTRGKTQRQAERALRDAGFTKG